MKRHWNPRTLNELHAARVDLAAKAQPASASSVEPAAGAPAPVLDGEQARASLNSLDAIDFAFAANISVEEAKARARAAVEALGLAGPEMTFHVFCGEYAVRVTAAHLLAASGKLHEINVMRLRVLRERIVRERVEDGLGYTLDDAQAAVFADICRALGMDKNETIYVIGAAYDKLVYGANGGQA